MQDEEEDVLGEDAFKMSDDDAEVDDIIPMEDFGLDEEDPDKDR